MNQYIISCCSTADLSEEHFRARQIYYTCFHYELNGVQYPDDLGKSMSFEDFYQAMADGAETKTSQVNAEEYEAFWEPFLQEGKDVLHLTLSSGISGSYNSANIAADILREKYPGRTIYVVDSLAASAGYGLLMDKVADLRDAGIDIHQLKEWVIDNRLKVNHWFFTSDLTYFIKGGRISKTAGFFGGMLSICPLLNVNHEGQLIPRFKVRTKKKVIDKTVNLMCELAENGTDYNGKCYISHSNCYEDAKTVADIIEAEFPQLNGEVEIYNVGTTIGSHTGPGTVALFFWGNERTE